MLNQPQRRTLTEGAQQLGVPLPDSVIHDLCVYLETLQRWSKIVDLVSQTDPEVIIRKHLLDSLALSPLLPSDCKIVDLGSGAGFPGLVTAIAEPRRQIVLIEPRRKRANFLKDVGRSVGLKNVSVSELRAESLVKEPAFQKTFDYVISRATWDIRSFLSFAEPLLKDNGYALIMKSLKGKQELKTLSVSESAFILQGEHSYDLPFGSEQRLIYVFQKNCST